MWEPPFSITYGFCGFGFKDAIVEVRMSYAAPEYRLQA